MRTYILWILAILIIGGGIFFAWQRGFFGSKSASQTPITSVSYLCDQGKTIAASYYAGTDTPGTDTTPPVPGGSVQLTLSDGRSLKLAQTISADGGRYSDGNAKVTDSEKIVFWNKGRGAFVEENGTKRSYDGCVEVAPAQTGLSEAYASGVLGFSLRYPTDFKVDAGYLYQGFGTGHDISGVKFTIDPATAKGTNLSTDSYLSVERLQNTDTCTADLFLPASTTPISEDGNGLTYSVATTSDAGAGNRYEETVYSIPGTSPCVAVRYFVHYSAIENYPEGAVKAFDRAALLKQFDAMRSTLVLE